MNAQINVTLQSATAAHAANLVAMQKEAFKRLYDQYHDAGSPYLRGTDEIMRWLERPACKVFLILADGEPVGGMAAWEQNGQPGTCYLARIFIRPAWQNKGIARRAILLCEAQFPDASRWTLDFPVDQIANRRCYEKAGYLDTGETRQQSGGRITLALFEKHVDNIRFESEDARRKRIYPVLIRPYNPAWPEWYAAEKANLERLIGPDDIHRISHIGSTAVPGLSAKPTIDMLLEINPGTDIGTLMARFPVPPYICLDQAALTLPTPAPHLMFLKGYLPDGFAEQVYHIHVRYPGDWDEPVFRDYLIAHPETAAEYATLKVSLLQRFEHDRDGYTQAKTAFIREATARARQQML